MKYEVYINRIASASFIVDANTEEDAEKIALREARNSYDFNNDGFPEYEVTEVYPSYDFIAED